MRVLLTRAEGSNGSLAAALRAGGVEPIEVPLIGFEPTGALPPDPRPGDLLVLTSATTLRWLAELGCWTRLSEVPIAAVGPATAKAIEALGVTPSLVPGQALAVALAREIIAAGPRRVLYPRAEEVPPEFERQLAEAGVEVVATPLYRTGCPAAAGAQLAAALPVDLVTLASGSAARHLAALLPPERCPPAVVIGPSTASACGAVGLRVVAMAEPHTAEGLAAAVLGLSGPAPG